jgi:hypothetical protein
MPLFGHDHEGRNHDYLLGGQSINNGLNMILIGMKLNF